MAKVQPEAESGKVRRFASSRELRRALRQWACERVLVGVGWRPPLASPAVDLSRRVLLKRRIEWLRSVAQAWQPRTDARSARIVSEQLLAALSSYARASAAMPGTSYFAGYVDRLAAEMEEHLARHVSWLKTLEPGEKKAGRHGWDAQTHLVMTLCQDQPNAPLDDLVACAIGGGLLTSEELAPLFGVEGHPEGPTLREGLRVKRKQIREILARHPVLYRTGEASSGDT